MALILHTADDVTASLKGGSVGRSAETLHGLVTME